MSKRVLKWPIPVTDRAHQIGAGPVVLVDMQDGAVTVWTEEDPPVTTWRPARIYGTGHEVPADARHLGSTIDGPFVWHVYEEAP